MAYENENNHEKLLEYKTQLLKVKSTEENFIQKTETIDTLCNELMETNKTLRELQENKIKSVEFFVETTLEEQHQFKEALTLNSDNQVVKWKYERILNDLDKYCEKEQMLLNEI